MRRALLASVLAFTLMPAPADAVVFFTRASFNAAVSSVVNNDLNALPVGQRNTVFGVETISSSTNPAGGYVSLYNATFGNALGGLAAGGGVDNFGSLTFTFTAPIYAFAFDDLDLTGTGGVADEFANVIVTPTVGPAQQFTLTDADGSFNTAAFFGFASNIPLASVTVWSSDTPGGPVGSRANLVDNLAISRVALVPEPGTWTLLLAGFGMLGWSLRHRARLALA